MMQHEQTNTNRHVAVLCVTALTLCLASLAVYSITPEFQPSHMTTVAPSVELILLHVMPIVALFSFVIGLGVLFSDMMD